MADTDLFVVHQLVAGERGDGLEEEVGGLAEVPDGHRVEAFIDLQPISTIPVATLFHHGVGSLQVGLNKLWRNERIHFIEYSAHLTIATASRVGRLTGTLAMQPMEKYLYKMAVLVTREKARMAH